MKVQLGKAELTSKRTIAVEQALEAQKERNELLLLTSTVDNSDPVVSECTKIKRRRALACLKAT